MLWHCVRVHHFGGYKYAARVRKRGTRATLETQRKVGEMLAEMGVLQGRHVTLGNMISL